LKTLDADDGEADLIESDFLNADDFQNIRKVGATKSFSTVFLTFAQPAERQRSSVPSALLLPLPQL
jgi:hypothetical protein